LIKFESNRLNTNDKARNINIENMRIIA